LSCYIIDSPARVILVLTVNPRVTVRLATLDAGASSVPLVTKGILLFLEICAFHFNNVILTAALVLALILIPDNVIARYSVLTIAPLLYIHNFVQVSGIVHFFSQFHLRKKRFCK